MSKCRSKKETGERERKDTVKGNVWLTDVKGRKEGKETIHPARRQANVSQGQRGGQRGWLVRNWEARQERTHGTTVVARHGNQRGERKPWQRGLWASENPKSWSCQMKRRWNRMGQNKWKLHLTEKNRNVEIFANLLKKKIWNIPLSLCCETHIELNAVHVFWSSLRWSSPSSESWIHGGGGWTE